jgi:hypothetical protein
MEAAAGREANASRNTAERSGPALAAPVLGDDVRAGAARTNSRSPQAVGADLYGGLV